MTSVASHNDALKYGYEYEQDEYNKYGYGEDPAPAQQQPSRSGGAVRRGSISANAKDKPQTEGPRAEKRRAARRASLGKGGNTAALAPPKELVSWKDKRAELGYPTPGGGNAGLKSSSHKPRAVRRGSIGTGGSGPVARAPPPSTGSSGSMHNSGSSHFSQEEYDKMQYGDEPTPQQNKYGYDQENNNQGSSQFSQEEYNKYGYGEDPAPAQQRPSRSGGAVRRGSISACAKDTPQTEGPRAEKRRAARRASLGKGGNTAVTATPVSWKDKREELGYPTPGGAGSSSHQRPRAVRRASLGKGGTGSGLNLSSSHHKRAVRRGSIGKTTFEY